MSRTHLCFALAVLAVVVCGGSQVSHSEPPPSGGPWAGASSAAVGPGSSLPRAPWPPDNTSRQLDKCRYQPECYLKGRCTTPTDPKAKGCEARLDNDCGHSQECAAWGRCAARNGACFPSQEGCAGSLACWQNGLCAVAPNGNACISTSDDQCKHSEFCEIAGQCSSAESRCVIGGHPDCVASGLCKKFGKCDLVHGECRPSKTEDCEQSDLCKSDHACKEVNFQCIDERHEH